MMRLEQIRELSSEEENNRGTHFMTKKKQSADPHIVNHLKTVILMISIPRAKIPRKKEIFHFLQSRRNKNLLFNKPKKRCVGLESKLMNWTHFRSLTEME
jgi:hypothetical protein